MSYRVDLDNFHGPMDLLLYLIKRDELDIYDIPIARITESYLETVGILGELRNVGAVDIDTAGEFLVLAATLMEIKSALLLPRPEAAAPAGIAAPWVDPRKELVEQLLAYKRSKRSAELLAEKRAEHERRVARVPAARPEEADEPPPLDMDEVQVWDLLDAFTKLMRETGRRVKKVHEVVDDDTPLELHAADIQDRLRRDPRLTLRQLVAGRRSRAEMIGVFLALLELVRERKIWARQEAVEDDIEIGPAPAAAA